MLDPVLHEIYAILFLFLVCPFRQGVGCPEDLVRAKVLLGQVALENLP